MIKGYSYKLREVQLSDAEFILSLRNDKSLNSFINKTSSNIKDQIEWISNYRNRDNDYYFVIENLKSSESEGLIAVYDIDETKKCGEWGRWIICKGSLASLESVYLIFKFSFEFLNLSTLFCRTVSDNKHVVNFHDSYGARRSALLSDYFIVNDSKYDVVEHSISFDAWKEKISPKLEKTVVKISKRI